MVRIRSIIGPPVTVLAVALPLSACGGEVALPSPLESAERGASGGAEPGGDFCGVLRELDAIQSDTDDPAQMVESLSRAGDSAPAELRSAFETLAGVVEQIGGLEQNDDADVAKTLEIVLDPAVQDAAERIDAYASANCGVELDDGDGSSPTPDDSLFGDTSPDDTSPDDTTPDDTIPGASGDIDLEHVDSILEEHKPAAWAEALNFTTVMNDTAVTLATGTPTGMSVTDALEACEAVRSALVSRNPDVTVEIRDGDKLLASSSTGEKCAAA